MCKKTLTLYCKVLFNFVCSKSSKDEEILGSLTKTLHCVEFLAKEGASPISEGFAYLLPNPSIFATFP